MMASLFCHASKFLFIFLLFKSPAVDGTAPNNPLKECQLLFDKQSYASSIEKCSEALSSPSSTVDKETALLIRAKAYEYSSRYRDALADLSQITSRSEALFTESRLRAANIHVFLGNYTAAAEAAKALKDESRSAKTLMEINRLTALESGLFGLSLPDGVDKALDLSSRILEASPLYLKALKVKVDALIYKGDYRTSLKTMQDITMIESDNTDANFLIGKLFLAQGDYEKGLKFVSACVALDEDRRDCLALRKKLKEVKSEISTADQKLLRPSISALEEILTDIRSEHAASPFHDKRFPAILLPLEIQVVELLCDKFAKIKDLPNAKLHCEKAAALNPALSEKIAESIASLHLELQNFEECIDYLKLAIKKYPRNHKLNELLQRANAEFKKSQQLDYYKILAVPRDASKEQIAKAYRRLAQRWHPDKHPNDRSAAEKKMREINLAVTVLSDAKKRSLFDRGIDPENPESASDSPFHQAHYGHANFVDLNDLFNFKQRHANQGGRRNDYNFRYDL